jgi:hypothetical protein
MFISKAPVEKGTATTLLCCMCLSEVNILPIVIFIGVRVND